MQDSKIVHTLGLKKKIVVLPSNEISEYLGRLVGKYIFFLNYVFKKHPKLPNFGAFSTFFLKKK